MGKRQNIYKGLYPAWNNSEFSRRYACWAINHMGWAKHKKANKKLAKKRLRERQRRELDG